MILLLLMTAELLSPTLPTWNIVFRPALGLAPSAPATANMTLALLEMAKVLPEPLWLLPG